MKSKMFMQRLFVVLSLFTLLFSLVACGKVEQGRQPSFPVTEYVSPTKLFSLYVPTGWNTQEVIPGAEILMANSEAALDHYRSESPLKSGELVLNFGFLPLAFLQEKELAHLGFQIEASPEVFLQSLLPMFRIDNEAEIDIGGEGTLVSLREGRDAGMLTFSNEEREGMILVFTAGKDVFAFVSAATYPGGLQEYQEVIYAVSAGVSYNGSQDALYSKLYGD